MTELPIFIPGFHISWPPLSFDSISGLLFFAQVYSFQLWYVNFYLQYSTLTTLVRQIFLEVKSQSRIISVNIHIHWIVAFGKEKQKVTCIVTDSLWKMRPIYIYIFKNQPLPIILELLVRFIKWLPNLGETATIRPAGLVPIPWHGNTESIVNNDCGIYLIDRVWYGRLYMSI